MSTERHIVHLDLDTFFVSVERLRNSQLKGRPVIIGGTSDRGVVASCSYEARRSGVRSAMPMKMARHLCPDAVYIRGDMEMYSRYSDMVTDIIAERAPRYEKASIDEHYLDITGMDRFFGCMKWTRELRQAIMQHTGLPISVGLSVNKTVSKIATGEAKPNGELEVPYLQVPSFLAPLSLRKIPMVGEKTFHLLRSMGIATIATLQEIPAEMMVNVLGSHGLVIWKRAHGIDHTPVEPWSDRKSVGAEITFEQDTTNIGRLHEILSGMVEKLAFQLRKETWLASCVTVKIRYANFDTHTRQQRIAYTAFDHILAPVVHSLFDRLYERRMRIRLIGVRFSYLVRGVQQIDMFEDTPEMLNLYQALDRIRRRFGALAIQRAVSIDRQWRHIASPAGGTPPSIHPKT